MFKISWKGGEMREIGEFKEIWKMEENWRKIIWIDWAKRQQKFTNLIKISISSREMTKFH